MGRAGLAAAVAALTLSALLPARIARSQEPVAAPPPVAARPCSCRYNGDRLPLGSRICLATPQGTRMARCGLEENVTSWIVSADACPTT